MTGIKFLTTAFQRVAVWWEAICKQEYNSSPSFRPKAFASRVGRFLPLKRGSVVGRAWEGDFSPIRVVPRSKASSLLCKRLYVLLRKRVFLYPKSPLCASKKGKNYEKLWKILEAIFLPFRRFDGVGKERNDWKAADMVQRWPAWRESGARYTYEPWRKAWIFQAPLQNRL